jgi:hypothetical protein
MSVHSQVAHDRWETDTATGSLAKLISTGG